MMRFFQRFETTLFHPDRRVAQIALAGLIFTGALAAALIVALAGPIYGVAAALAVVAAALMLRDLRWGLVALFAVIGLLPFATLPFKIGFTPTFLDLGAPGASSSCGSCASPRGASATCMARPSARWCWCSCCWRSSPSPTACVTAGRR